MKIHKVLLLDENLENVNFFKYLFEKWKMELISVQDVQNSLIRVNIIKPDFILISTDLEMDYGNALNFLANKNYKIFLYGKKKVGSDLQKLPSIKKYFPLPIDVINLKNDLMSNLNPNYTKEEKSSHIDVVVNDHIGVVEFEKIPHWEVLHQIRFQINHLFGEKKMSGIIIIFHSSEGGDAFLEENIKHFFNFIKDRKLETARVKYLCNHDNIVSILNEDPFLRLLERVKSYAEAYLKIESINLEKSNIGTDIDFIREDVKLVENVYDEYGNLIKNAGEKFSKEDIEKLKKDNTKKIYYPKELSYLGIGIDTIAGVKKNIEEIIIKQAEVTTEEISDTITGGKKLILIVDDDLTTQKILTRAVEKLGYNFRLVDNGVDALRSAIQFNPNLIILDLMIPRLNGPQFIKKYKELRKKQVSPIIVVSGVSRSDVIAPILKMGVKDYILKPVNLQTLTEKIQKNIS